MNIIALTEQYIKENDLDITPEALFIEFKIMVELHQEFDIYLKNEGLNENLEKMNRNKRRQEKRKLFIDWFTTKNQNNKLSKQIVIDLSEMLFVTPKTIRNTYFNGNYGQKS